MNPLELLPQTDYAPPISEDELSDEQVLQEIGKLKRELADQIIFLGHHYQQDDIVSFADITGDSLELSRRAAKEKKPYIIFCGVHFMAETADILTSDLQKVILPDLNAGCSMADMATIDEVRQAWNVLNEATNASIIPITYINCAATLKAFVGEKGGSICTSSNAKKIVSWALSQGEKLLFFPDQHLGRNTCFDLGIPLDQMVIYDPRLPNGGLSTKQIEQARVILWYGYCSVHQGFTLEQVQNVKKKSPNTTVIVHPECPFEVVQAAHQNGSTSQIIDIIAKAPAGSSFAVGTEINLVNRLAKMYPDKKISSLSPYQCLCTTMYRVRPRWLLDTLRSIKNGHPKNVIHVPTHIRNPAIKALNRMLEIS